MPNNETLQKVVNLRIAFDEYYKKLDYETAQLKQRMEEFPDCDKTGDALKNEMPLLLKNKSAAESVVVNQTNELGLIASTYNCMIPVFK